MNCIPNSAYAVITFYCFFPPLLNIDENNQNAAGKKEKKAKHLETEKENPE